MPRLRDKTTDGVVNSRSPSNVAKFSPRAGAYTPTVIAPELSVRAGRAAVEFYQAAFGAVEVYRVGGTGQHEAVVSQLSIHGGSFWVADESPAHFNFSPETVGGSTTRMLLVVDDPDEVVRRAGAVAPGGRRGGAPSGGARSGWGLETCPTPGSCGSDSPQIRAQLGSPPNFANFPPGGGGKLPMFGRSRDFGGSDRGRAGVGRRNLTQPPRLFGTF